MKNTSLAIFPFVIALSACGGDSSEMIEEPPLQTPIFDARVALYESLRRSGGVQTELPLSGTADYSGPISLEVANASSERVLGVMNIGVSFGARQFSGTAQSFINARDESVVGALAFTNGTFGPERALGGALGTSDVTGTLLLDDGEAQITGRTDLTLSANPASLNDPTGFAGSLDGSVKYQDGSINPISSGGFVLERQ